MEIKFEKLNGIYVAEFEITSNCNIHIEREELGMFTIESRGSKSGKYVPMENGYYGDKYIIDVDMLGSIYPKYIKVTSTSMPTYAEVNFAEEGGSGNSGDGGSIEYYKIDENFLSTIDEQNASIFVVFPCFLNKDAEVTSLTMLYLASSDTPPTEILTSSQGIALFPDVEILTAEDGIFTFNDMVEMLGIDISKWQKITKEEFYNLKNNL